MPRRRSAPRLYLDPKRKQWTIRDGSRGIRTGFAAGEIKQAEEKLSEYPANKHASQEGLTGLISPNMREPQILPTTQRDRAGWRQNCQLLRFECIVSKRKGSPYRSGLA